MFTFLKRAFHRYPSTSKIFIAGALFSLSDALTQIFIQKIKFDPHRNLLFLACGTLYIGPFVEIWYTFLLPKLANRFFHNSSKLKRVLGCILLDQLLFGIPMICGFYLFREFLNNPSWEGLEKGREELRERFLDTYLVDLSIWPGANFINFWFISVKYQGLFVNLVTFFFNVALSYVSNVKKEKQIKSQ